MAKKLAADICFGIDIGANLENPLPAVWTDGLTPGICVRGGSVICIESTIQKYRKGMIYEMPFLYVNKADLAILKSFIRVHFAELAGKEPKWIILT